MLGFEKRAAFRGANQEILEFFRLYEKKKLEAHVVLIQKGDLNDFYNEISFSVERGNLGMYNFQLVYIRSLISSLSSVPLSSSFLSVLPLGNGKERK